MNEKIILGLPKGSLNNVKRGNTYQLFVDAGYEVRGYESGYESYEIDIVNDLEINAYLTRPQSVPVELNRGMVDIAIVGEDWIKEDVDKKLIKREKAIIALLIQEKENVIEQIKKEIRLEDFKSEINKKILQKLYEEYEKGNSNINAIMNAFVDDEETMSRLTEIMAEEYQIEPDQKTIKNVINTYKIEKLDNKKMELLEKEQDPNLTKEEREKIIEEINKIIIQKKLVK